MLAGSVDLQEETKSSGNAECVVNIIDFFSHFKMF